MSASFSLSGLSLADWNAAAQAAFASGVAQQLGIGASQVELGDAAEGARRRRRSALRARSALRRGLLAAASSSLKVPFKVSGLGADGSAATGVMAAISSPATGAGLAGSLAASGIQTTAQARRGAAQHRACKSWGHAARRLHALSDRY